MRSTTLLSEILTVYGFRSTEAIFMVMGNVSGPGLGILPGYNLLRRRVSQGEWSLRSPITREKVLAEIACTNSGGIGVNLQPFGVETPYHDWYSESVPKLL